MRISLFFISFFFIQLGFAQHFVLHKAVGDTITLDEKQQYVLFTDIPDEGVSYMLLDSSEVFVNAQVYKLDNTVISQQILWEEIEVMRLQIEKLVAYFAGELEGTDQKSVLTQKDSTISLEGKLLNEKSQEAINEAVRRDVKINQDATRQQLYKQGLETSPGSIELFSTGKQKKKKN
jgi:hypothetical protein